MYRLRKNDGGGCGSYDEIITDGSKRRSKRIRNDGGGCGYEEKMDGGCGCSGDKDGRRKKRSKKRSMKRNITAMFSRPKGRGLLILKMLKTKSPQEVYNILKKKSIKSGKKTWTKLSTILTFKRLHM